VQTYWSSTDCTRTRISVIACQRGPYSVMYDGPMRCFKDEWDSRVPASLPCKCVKSHSWFQAFCMLKHTKLNVFDCWYSLSNHYRYSATVERFLTISSNNVLMHTKHGPSSQDSTWHGKGDRCSCSLRPASVIRQSRLRRRRGCTNGSRGGAEYPQCQRCHVSGKKVKGIKTD